MKNLYLIIGASGSGKTTLERNLCNYFGASAVRSFTTRPPRKDGDMDHYFVTNSEFDQLGELVAYTEYNGHRYGVTKDILDKADFYVIDPEGAKYLMERYTDRPICAIWLETDRDRRIIRMAQQGRSEEDILKRIRLDDEAFSEKMLHLILHKLDHGRVCILYADSTKDHVLVDAAIYVVEREKLEE